MYSHSYECPVWTYTSNEGSNAPGTLETPLLSLDNRQTLCPVRDAPSNRVSLIPATDLPPNRGDAKLTTNAHGVIAQDGWAKAINPSFRPEQRDSEPMLPYARGERIWIEESLLPTDPGDLIPVVSLDTGNFFSMSSKHICFVPDLWRCGVNGGFHYATFAGPVHSAIVDGQTWRIQGYFERSSLGSRHAVLKWWKTKAGDCSPSDLGDFTPLQDEHSRRLIFGDLWMRLCRHNTMYPTEETDRDRCQSELNPVMAPNPKSNEHLHTPPSRLVRPSLSKRALRTANVPYRLLHQRSDLSEASHDSTTSRVFRARYMYSHCCNTQHKASFYLNEPESSMQLPNRTRGAVRGETDQEMASQPPFSDRDSNIPIVFSLRIEPELADSQIDLPSEQDSSDEDYEML